MGIPIFSTYIQSNSKNFLKLSLHDSILIIDGPCFLYRISRCHSIPTEYGGNYKEFIITLHKWLDLFDECNIKPIFIFDGCREADKTVTNKKRGLSTLKSLREFTASGFKGSPSLIGKNFTSALVDTLKKRNIPVFCSCRESDQVCAAFGLILDCPVLSGDSDFYFFSSNSEKSVKFILLDTLQDISMEFLDKSKKIVKGIECRMINRNGPIFSNLKTSNIPLLVSLIGNDFSSENYCLKIFKNLTPYNRYQQFNKCFQYFKSMNEPHDVLTERIASKLPSVIRSKFLNLVALNEEFYFPNLEKIAQLYGSTIESYFSDLIKVENKNYLYDDFLDLYPEQFCQAFLSYDIESHNYNALFTPLYVHYGIVEDLNEPCIQKIDIDIRQITYSIIFFTKSQNKYHYAKADNGIFKIEENMRADRYKFESSQIELKQELITVNKHLLLPLDKEPNEPRLKAFLDALILCRKRIDFFKSNEIILIFLACSISFMLNYVEQETLSINEIVAKLNAEFTRYEKIKEKLRSCLIKMDEKLMYDIKIIHGIQQVQQLHNSLVILYKTSKLLTSDDFGSRYQDQFPGYLNFEDSELIMLAIKRIRKFENPALETEKFCCEELMPGIHPSKDANFFKNILLNSFEYVCS